MFSLQPGLAAKVEGHQHWIKVDDADGMYALHKANGATIVEELMDRPWGTREYVVKDPGGYHLRFAGPPSAEVARSQPFPEGVELDRRKPTPEEYADIAGKTFEYKQLVPGILESTWGGVVALSPAGEVIAVTRIMHDAPGWFSIWDVAVLPQWQGRRIGTRMMEEALSMIREFSAGAIVHLFTYRHGFYERLGFGKESVSMLRL